MDVEACDLPLCLHHLCLVSIASKYKHSWSRLVANEMKNVSKRREYVKLIMLMLLIYEANKCFSCHLLS